MFCYVACYVTKIKASRSVRRESTKVWGEDSIGIEWDRAGDQLMEVSRSSTN